MSDESDRESPELDQELEEEEVKPKPRGKRAVSDVQLKNLAKARATKIENLKKAPNLIKYPKSQRATAEERYKLDLKKEAERMAEERAQQILAERDKERELEELRRFKKEMEKMEKDKVEEPVKKTPVKGKAKPKVTKKAASDPKAKKAAPKKRKNSEPSADYVYSGGSYNDPYDGINVASTGNSENWSTFTPSSGQVFRSDASSVININIPSPNQFARLRRNYTKATIVARAADGSIVQAAGTTLTSLGFAACFQRLAIDVGAANVESNDQYPTLLSMVYNNAPLNRKKVLGALEGYNSAMTPNSLPSGTATFCHGLQSSIMMSNQEFPLPLVQGGINIRIWLAPAKNVFLSANVAYYTLENVSFNCQMIDVAPELLLKYMSGLDQGRSLYIPMVQVQSFANYGSGGSQQQVNLSVGSKRSIQSFATIFRTEADMSDATKDKNTIMSSQGLQNWQMQVAGKLIPSIRAWAYNPSGAAYDPEHLAIALASQDTIYTADQSVDFDLSKYDSQNFSIRYNFSSSDETFGSGIDTTIGGGMLTLTTNHSGAVGSNVRITTFVFVDCLLQIRKDIIEVDYVW